MLAVFSLHIPNLLVHMLSSAIYNGVAACVLFYVLYIFSTILIGHE
jgi:hypothetical protein